MSPSFFEHFFTSGTMKCARFFLSFLCSSLETTSSTRSPSSSHCKKIFRNHDLVSRWDRCYWGVIASKSSQRTKLYIPYVYVYIYIVCHTHTYIFISTSWIHSDNLCFQFNTTGFTVVFLFPYLLTPFSNSGKLALIIQMYLLICSVLAYI